MGASARVVVLGGGFAGLETTFMLRDRLGHDVDLTLVSERPEFLFRPNTIYIPFGAAPDSLKVPLARPAHHRKIELVQARVREVDPVARRVELEDQAALAYDYLVVATGAGMRLDEVPGLAEHADTVWTPPDMLRLRATIEDVVDRAKRGERSRVLFLIPPNNKCSGPLYEIAFMLETHLRRRKVRDHVDLTWATVESGYIQAFGPRLDEVVTEEFAKRGIEGHKDREVVEVVAGEVRFRDGGTLGFDRLVSFPPYVAAVRYGGLPGDERGFLQTDLGSRRVTGTDEVFAPGDAGDFPVKQAYLALLEAGATAAAIEGAVRDREPRSEFEPVSLCVMEQFDQAVFAEVPLRLTGDPARPVEVRPDAGDDYKVGVSPLWRLGKKMLGLYLPMRFRSGEPFHAGPAWQTMELGLRGMSAVLAD